MAGFGVSFLPTGQGQSGATQDRAGGTASNISPLNTAWNLLSLRLPKFLGAGSLAPQNLMDAPGAAGAASAAPPSLMGGSGSTVTGGESGVAPAGEGPSGFDPNAALFEAAIRALLAQGSSDPVTAPPGAGGGFASAPIAPAVEAPRIIPGVDEGGFGPIVSDDGSQSRPAYTPPPPAEGAYTPPSWERPGRPPKGSASGLSYY